MKWGDLEGTSEEITDFFENTGLDPSNYFQPVEKPIRTAWLVVPAVVVLLAVFALWLNLSDGRYQWLAFLVGCLGTVWLGCSVQIRYKQGIVTTVAAAGCIGVLLVAFGLLSPLEAIEQLKQLRK